MYHLEHHDVANIESRNVKMHPPCPAWHHCGHDEHDEKGEMAEGGDEGVVQANPVCQPRHDDKDSKGLDISFSSNEWVLYSFEPFLSLCHLGHINSSVILCQPSHLKKKDEKTRVT